MTADLIVKISVIALIAIATVAALRRHSAALRHWVLATALACVALAPALALVVPPWNVRMPGADAVVDSTTSVESVAVAVVASRATRSRQDVSIQRAERSSLPRVTATGIWIVGAALNLAVLIVGLARLSWLTSRCRPVRDARWLSLVEGVSRAYGLRRPASLLQSDQPALLVTWGCLRPKVILPAASREWSDERMRVVLCHELAHVRRRDWLVQMAAELLRSAYWFNPLVWIACGRLRQESEQACDDEVLNLGVDGPEYATHLLDLARAMRRHRRLWSPALAMARASSLERRISAMLNARLTRTPITRSSRVAIVVALLAVTLPVAGLTLFAQAFATFSGSLVDPSNAVLPNVTLVLTNTERRAKYEVRSDRNGHFEFVGLPPGEYQFDARLPGFANVQRTLTMTGQDVEEDIKLQVGSLEEVITVTDDGVGALGTGSVREVRARPLPPCNASTTDERVGGNIRPPVKIRDVRPLYPPSLRASKAQGEVKMKGVVGTDGFIKTLDVISTPHPDLAAAATDAVRQWAFDSTLLNCVPIEVSLDVSVTFKAQQ